MLTPFSKSFLISVFLLLGIQSVFSKSYRFDNNTQLQVNLSRAFNTLITVKDDKITDVTYPENTFSRNETKLSDGSIYLKPLYPIPIPVYLTTQGGRRVSLLIVPTDGPSEPVLLVPNAPTENVTHWETSQPYTALLETLIESIYKNDLPKSYAHIPVEGTWQKGAENTALKLTDIARGNKLSAYEYLLKNTTKNPIVLSPRYFYHAGVRAVSIANLVSHTLMPGKTTTLILIEGEPS